MSGGGSVRALRARVAPALKRALSDVAAGIGGYGLAGVRYAGLGVIFLLHRVVEPGRPLIWPGFEIHADVLDDILARTRRLGWEPVTLDEAHRRLTDGPDARRGRFACFTLDDGYEDNLRVALPVFRKHRAPFCVYVAAGLVERSVFYWWGALEELVRRHERIEWEEGGARRVLRAGTWREKQVAYDVLSDLCHRDGPERARALAEAYAVDWRALLDRDALSAAQVRELAADPLATIGSHGVAHQPLATLDDAAARDDLERGRRILEGWADAPVRHLAYPYGGPRACGAREFELARQVGYATATTTRRGNLFPEHRGHLTSLPRREVPLDRVSLRNTLYGVETVLRRQPRLQAG